MIISIDGPSYSGKSTCAKLLAEKLNYFYLNSGFLYRAVTYLLLNIYKFDKESLSVKVFDCEFFKQIIASIKYDYVNNVVKIYVYEKDVTDKLKSIEISETVSIVASDKILRDLIKDWQYKIFEKNKNIIVEGRDIGTVVFKNADKKFYITASLDERALRMHKSIKLLSFEDAKNCILKRDNLDKNRVIAPLYKSIDAIEIDNSGLSIDSTLEKILFYL